MKCFLSTVLVAASAFGAIAADLPSRTPPSPPAPVFAQSHNWSGFYVGANVGYGWGHADFSITPGGYWVGDADLDGVTSAATRRSSIDGIVGGLQAGYNWQVGSLVIGVEADANLSKVSGGFSSPTFNGLYSGTYTARGAAGSDWFSTIRLRFGFAADRALFYVTGGLAIVENHFSHSVNFQNEGKVVGLPITGPDGGANAVSRSTVNYSWTLGGGVEYALNQNWSAKIEYLFVDMGDNAASSRYSSSVCNSPCSNLDFDLRHREKKHMNVVRFGVNYKFGGGAAPVVARY
jgi:outer membrane immunogenic protein